MMSARWTYKVVEVKAGMFGIMKAAAVQETLNQHGVQGWELVSVAHAGFNTWLYLKKSQ